jgi:hypothetical protein
MSGETEKATWEDDFEMEPEYDFSDGVANPYAARFGEGTTLVTLESDVATAFPDSVSVNEALRVLIKAAKNVQEPAKNAQELAKAS